MDLSSNQNKQKNSPIRDAAALSGYSTGYISSLCRTGKIIGTYSHNEWSVDIASLERFLKKQAERKEVRARSLADARANEYRTHLQKQDVQKVVSPQDTRSGILQHDSRSGIVFRRKKEEEGLRASSLRSNVLALSAALLVVASGAVVAQASILPQFAANTADSARIIAAGFTAAFGDIPKNIIAKIDATKNTMSEVSPRASSSSMNGEPILLAINDLSSVRIRSLETEDHVLFVRRGTVATVSTSSTAPSDVRNRSVVVDAYEFITHPERIADSLIQAYIAFGQSIVDATHAVIRADVSLAYGTAAAAPATARATVALISGTGDMLARATALVSIHTGATLAVVVQRLGEVGYESAKSARDAIAVVVPPQLPDIGGALEDAYLGMLGKSALALDTFARTPKIAAVLTAVQPALNVGEQIALATYDAIHSFLGSANRGLAFLLGPTPVVIQPSSMRPVVVLATSTPSSSPSSIFSNSVSYPTYTTVVQGVSKDFVSQSLASLRADLLATLSGQVQPIRAQTVTNASTIQYVNMIQKLDSLTVTNGTFTGGIFDSG
ncbi:MAG: hypothetical protein NUV60_00735, partial [Patescibacteria group bacterium]|nr:hypothetical protein [Patescibacteria group bacterium]